MAHFEAGFWVVMSNSGGELDRKWVKGGRDEGERLAAAMSNMIYLAGELAEGDTLRVIAGESEAVELDETSLVEALSSF